MDKTQEILLIDKPKGISSFDVIRRLRKEFGVRKLGHAGTLDPLATGLLVVGVGKGTKKLRDYVGLSKMYEAEVFLGKKTTTGDMEGEVLEEKQVENIDERQVRALLREMEGTLVLPVPAYSAVKQGGVPLYRRMRRGERVVVPKKEMEIHLLELTGHKPCEDGYVLGITCEVGSGTYVRAIAEEVGRRLGVPATLKELRRTRVGEFRVEDAMSLKSTASSQRQ